MRQKRSSVQCYAAVADRADATCAVVLLCLLFANSLTASLVTGPIVNPANGHSYYLLSSAPWAASQSEAVALNGNLATINDDSENVWVFDTFANYGGTARNLWIGLNDASVEGQFVWVSGEAAPYRAWTPGQPSGLGPNGEDEDYVHFWAPASNVPLENHYKWNDHPGSGTLDDPPFSEFGGVVEVVPEPSSVALIAAFGCIVLWGRWRRAA